MVHFEQRSFSARAIWFSVFCACGSNAWWTLVVWLFACIDCFHNFPLALSANVRRYGGVVVRKQKKHIPHNAASTCESDQLRSRRQRVLGWNRTQPHRSQHERTLWPIKQFDCFTQNDSYRCADCEVRRQIELPIVAQHLLRSIRMYAKTSMCVTVWWGRLAWLPVTKQPLLPASNVRISNGG